MNHTEIHQALKKQDLNWRIAAEAIGCSPHHLMNITARRGKSRATAVALCVLLGRDVASVFPDISSYHSDPKVDRKTRVQHAKAQLAEAGLRTA